MTISRMQQPRQMYQEGGIMPRLNQLGNSVSSAEQMLQGINQRLQSAESSLGEGEGGGNQFINATLPKTLQIAGGTTAPLNSGFMQPVSMNNPRTPDLRAIPEFMKDPSYQPIQMALPESPAPGSAMQSPMSQAMRNMAAGGGMMGRQMYQRGGIMEVAPRQGAIFGGLKKAVSSALGSAKKILKSPLGKAAALYFAPALIPGGAKTLGGVFKNMGGLGGLKTALFANPAIYQQKLMGAEKGFFPGLMDKFSSMSPLARGATMFGIGALGGGALAALEASGVDTENPNEMPRNVEALKAYLKQGYLKLNPDKSEQEAEEFAEANTVEYRANGGRIGFADGMPKEKFLSYEEAKAMNPGMFSAEVETDVVRPNTELLNYIKRIKDAAEKGTIPMDFAMDLIKQKTMEQGVDLKDLRDDIMETQRIEQAYGGRLGYAFGDVVDQASGIMGLPQRINQAGVKELDLRDSGGFIPPVGVKEKADDIPAMLSNNEFVFTADAVRGAGKGNVNEGAKKMYALMRKLEAGGKA